MVSTVHRPSRPPQDQAVPSPDGVTRVRCLSLTQPWATLVVLGEKRIETRGWRTTHRGWLAIHATSQAPDATVCRAQPFGRVLADHGIVHPADLPLGVVIGAVRLVSCVDTTAPLIRGITPRERAFGDYGPGRAAWILEDPRLFPTPIAARGYPWLFMIDVPTAWLETETEEETP